MDYSIELPQLTAKAAKLLAVLSAMKLDGRFFSVRYTSEPSGIRKAWKNRLLKSETFTLQRGNYANYKSVIKAKESGELQDGKAGINEIPIADNGLVFFNTKTKKVKLRLPMNSVAKNGGEYFLDGERVSKEEFYELCKEACYSRKESKPVQAFRSFELDKLELMSTVNK